MPSSTAAGSTLAISAGTPATQNTAGYAALTYTEIGSIEKLGPSGATFDKVDFQPLKGPKQKHKGSVDYGTMQPSMAHDDADAGQDLLRVSADNQTALYAFKVTRPDATVKYFQARVFSYTETIDNASSILMGASTIEINTQIF
jgi:hypothetical protein